jgi:hypothetical protein
MLEITIGTGRGRTATLKGGYMVFQFGMAVFGSVCSSTDEETVVDYTRMI